MLIHVARDPREFAHLPVPEIEGGLPVHPANLPNRVLTLIKSGQDFLTASQTVLKIVGWFVRTKSIAANTVTVRIQGCDYDNEYDARGDLIMPWPEVGFDSVLDAPFHYLFDRGSLLQ